MNFTYRDETKQLNDRTRRNADGCFIQLPDGVTHYELGGPESGDVVVLVHGFSVPYFIYDPLISVRNRQISTDMIVAPASIRNMNRRYLLCEKYSNSG